MAQLNAKWEHYLDQTIRKLNITTPQLETEELEADHFDPWMAERINYMYDYYDWRHCRHRVRERFIKHCNRKSTLEDIGYLLDKWTYDSKANTEYFHMDKHLLEQPSQAK